MDKARDRSFELPRATEKLERRMIGAALAGADHNHSAAARRLGISSVGLLKMMARLGMRRAE
jgi:transcriptional regulator with GAF, ATPase, and Fis domain